MTAVIGVTGATGQVGGRIARRLSERGERFRLIARDVTRLPELPGAEVVAFGGYSDSAGMRSACAGVGTLFLVSAKEAPDRVDQHRTAIDAAVEAGVERIVYLSLISAAPDATFSFARHHFATEQYIRDKGVAFTFSRQSLYMDIVPFLAGQDGVIRGPAGQGRLAPVLRDDVADAVTTMLSDPGHEGATYQLTGPDVVTFREIAELLTESVGRSVSFVDETLEEAQASRAGYGAPAWEVEGWITTYTAVASGEFDVVSDDVQALTGHAPVGLREFLATLE